VVALTGQTDSPAEDHVQLVSASGNPFWVDFSAEPSAAQWRRSGDLRPMSGGGFILTRIGTLVTVARDDIVAASALPRGYRVQAPMRDPDLFLLGKLSDDNGMEARDPVATGVDVFRRSTGSLTHVDASVAEIQPSTTYIAFLATTDGRWLGLDADGKTTEIAPSGAQGAWIAPDGSRAAQVSNSTGVTMIKLPSGERIASGFGPVLSAISWGRDGQAAYWTEDPAVAKKVVVLAEDGIGLLTAPR
jgi:hypothetical protein